MSHVRLAWKDRVHGNAASELGMLGSQQLRPTVRNGTLMAIAVTMRHAGYSSTQIAALNDEGLRLVRQQCAVICWQAWGARCVGVAHIDEAVWDNCRDADALDHQHDDGVPAGQRCHECCSQLA
jgi:hypothetical protein